MRGRLRAAQTLCRWHEASGASAGAYFVTIVTYQRDPLFGEITQEEMILNDFGKIADECWRAIPEHFPFVELGAYVVMPNHLHGVVVINDDDDHKDIIYRVVGRGTPAQTAGAGCLTLLSNYYDAWQPNIPDVIKP